MLSSNRVGVLVGLLAITVSGYPSSVFANYVSCPDRPEVKCVPGKVGARVVCAGEDGVIEYENVTAFCIDCHSRGGDRQGGARKMSWGHSLEVEYPVGRKGFTDPANLYKAIRLTNGRVTCESCHGGKSKSNHFLSVHPREPNLCVHCHNKM